MATVPHCVLSRGRLAPDEPAHLVRDRRGWITVRWGQYAQAVREVGRALLAVDVAAGERIALLARGGPTWVVVDVAAMACGALPVGLCANEPADDVAAALHYLNPTVVLIDSAAQWEIIRAHRAQLSALRVVVATPECEPIDAPEVLPWEDFVARADERPASELEARLASLQDDAPAALIYEPSGTSPRAAMLSHRNLMWSAHAFAGAVKMGSRDCALSYLSPAFIGEQLVSIYAPAVSGAHIYFSSGLANVAAELREIQPTIVLGVPRVWQKLYGALASKLGRSGGWRAAVVAWARTVVGRFHGRSKPGVVSSALRYLASRLVLAKVRAAIGLANAKVALTTVPGPGPDATALFTSLDLAVVELYGRSETTGVVALDGLPLASPGPRVEVRVANDGELLVRGPNVFLGYFAGDESTQPFRDGWLVTGDLGTVARGHISIAGAKRDALVTAAGRTVAPAALENKLKGAPFIDEVVVVGDPDGHLSALVSVDESALPSPQGRAPSTADLATAVAERIDQLNRELEPSDSIREFRLLPRGLTVDGGELSPTFEVRRSVVAAAFAGLVRPGIPVTVESQGSTRAGTSEHARGASS